MYRLIDWYDGEEEEIAIANSFREIADEWKSRVEDTDGECMLNIRDEQDRDITDLVLSFIFHSH